MRPTWRRWAAMTTGLAIALGGARSRDVRAQSISSAFPNVLVNGAFEEAAPHDRAPAGWRHSGVVERATGRRGKRNGVLVVIGTTDQPDAEAAQDVSLPQPPPAAMTAACLVKIEELHAVEGGEGVAKFSVSFFDAGGGMIRSKTVETWKNTGGWRPWSHPVSVPPGAVTARVTLAVSGSTGEAMFDDVRVFWEWPDDYDLHNFVIDGGFEYMSPWSAWELADGAKVLYPGRDSGGLLRLSAKDAEGAQAEQRFLVPDAGLMHDSTLSLWVKLDGVEARHGGGAIAEVTFRDAVGRELQRPTRFGPWTGSAEPWAQRGGPVAVPPEAREGTVRFALEGASGKVFIDDVRLTAADERAVRPATSQTDTSSWRPYVPADAPLLGPMDAGEWVHAPAGGHGFLTVRDGHFAFEDGTAARFFGVDLDGEAALPSHEQADWLVQRLAQMGCNLVRLHHLDAPGLPQNIFDPSVEDTQHFSADSLDRLDYLLAQLKARGIYVYLDLLVSRQFKAGDGVAAFRELPKGAKIAAEFNERLIDLQQRYARDLLTHTNPYTKTRLVDDPTIALMEIINESSLFRLPKKLKTLPDVYRSELQSKWMEFAKQHGESQPDAERYQRVDDPLVEQFLSELQLAYFHRMHAFLRDLGLKIPVAGSNYGLGGADLQTNAALDFIDRHAYWDPPRGQVGILGTFHNRSLLQSPDADNPIVKLASLRVPGKPFVVSEWNVDWPNDERAVGPLVMAAAASIEGWDAVLQFSYQGERAPARLASNFDISSMPEMLWQWPVAARLFHRGDLRGGVASWPIAIARPATDRGQTSSAGPANGGDSRPAHIEWNASAGTFTIGTARTQAALGHVGGSTIALPDARLTVSTPFAAIALSSLDASPIGESTHLVVSAVARSENRGMRFNALRTQLRDAGSEPILQEPVVGELRLLRSRPCAAEAFVLDAAGRRDHAVALRVEADAITLPLGDGWLYELSCASPSAEAPPSNAATDASAARAEHTR